MASERHEGCLIGLCLGDALGSPVEGTTRAIARSYVHAIVKPRRFTKVRRQGHAVMQYTDDSQFTRELALTLLEEEGADFGRFAKRIARLCLSGEGICFGRATYEAAVRLERGVHWREAGTPAPAAGNGGAIRAVALGLYHAGDPHRAARAAALQCKITHLDPRSIAAARVIAAAIARLVEMGEPLDAEELCRELALLAEEEDPTLADGLLTLPSLLSLPPEEALPRILAIGDLPAYCELWDGISSFATHVVLWGLYAYFRGQGDYLAAVGIAIAGGGDTDSTAAITGALIGAHLGLNALPAEAATAIHDQGAWGFEEMLALARALAGRRKGG